MTLHSRIRISDPIDVVQLLDDATRAVGGDPATARRYDTRTMEPERLRYYSDAPEHVEIGNDLGQGFAAIVDVTWRPEGQTLNLGYFDRPDEDYPDEDWTPAPPALIELSLDTAYGGRSRCLDFDGNLVSDVELDCSMLHLWIAAMIEHKHGIVVSFYNEFDGTWGTLIEQAESMISGAPAADAFSRRVLAAVTSGR